MESGSFVFKIREESIKDWSLITGGGGGATKREGGGLGGK